MIYSLRVFKQLLRIRLVCQVTFFWKWCSMIGCQIENRKQGPILVRWCQRYSCFEKCTILSHRMTYKVAGDHCTNSSLLLRKENLIRFITCACMRTTRSRDQREHFNASFHWTSCFRLCCVEHSRNVENTRLRLVFSTFPSCSQMPVVFYHSVIHGLGFFICYIKAIQLVNTRVIVQPVLLSFLPVYIFLMPSKVIIIVLQFMFLGINMFWSLLSSF